MRSAVLIAIMSIVTFPFGIPELIAVAFVAGVQAWKRKSLISILSGTVLYMVLVQTLFR